MTDHRVWTPWLAALGLAAAGAPLGAAEPPRPDPQALAAKIDELIAARWVEAGVKPAAPTDDAEFLRRVYLDVAGKIPPVSEVRRFLDDRSPDKRQRAVEQLLDSPGHVAHFTNVWRAVILPESNSLED